MKTILHVDLDAFFAACEQREHPEWKGKPVVVGADPQQGAGRGVVSTASYEARKYGIHSALPISRAYTLCPTAIFVRPNFRLYSETSRKIMQILERYADVFLQVGIDEAYLDVSSRVETDEEKLALAQDIKAAVQQETQLTCSIGVATNKLVAKIASDYNKPAGITYVRPGTEKNFLEQLPVRKLIGVGPKTELALKDMDIATIGQLAALPYDFLREHFGKFGLYLHDAANGLYEGKLEYSEGIKSISRDTTFLHDIDNKALLMDTITQLAKRAQRQLQKNNLLARTIGIRVRYEDFETHTREQTLSIATDTLSLITSIQKALLMDFLDDKRRIRLVGVRLTNFEEATAERQRMLAEYVQ